MVRWDPSLDNPKKGHGTNSARYKEDCNKANSPTMELDEMYLVSVPLDSDDDECGKPLSELRLQFGHIPSLKQINFPRSDIPRQTKTKLHKHMKRLYLSEPHRAYPGKCARTVGGIFNSISILLFCIAAGVAFYYNVLVGSLLLYAKEAANDCATDANMRFLPLTTTFLMLHTIRGINATIWNLEQAALLGIDSLTTSFSNSSFQVCQARNNASENATHSMADWTSEHLNQVEDSANNLARVISTIEDTLSFSGMALPNKSSLIIPNMTIPRDPKRIQCDLQGVNTTAINSAKSNVTGSITASLNRLNQLVNTPLPRLNSTHIQNCGLEYSNGASQVKYAGQICVSVLVILGFIAIIPSIFWERWKWKRYRDLELRQSHDDPLNVSFRTEHPVLSNFSRFVSYRICKVYFHCNHAVYQTRIEWGLNFCISGYMFGFLAAAAVLAIASISCSAIYNQMNSLGDDKSTLGGATVFASQMNHIYGQFEKSLNDNCYNLLLNLLDSLNANHIKLGSTLASQFGFGIDVVSPFSSGVAFEHMNFPISTNASLTTSNQTPDFMELTASGNKNYPLIKLLSKSNTYLWVSSVVIFCVWLISFLLICGYTIRRVLNSEYDLKETPDIYIDYKKPPNTKVNENERQKMPRKT